MKKITHVAFFRSNVSRYVQMLAVMLFLLTSFSSLAQGYVTLGAQSAQSGNTTTSPVSGYYNSRRIQVVYTAAELIASGAAAGNIQRLAWDVSVAYTGAGGLPDYTIKMAHITTADIPTTTFVTPLTTVKNASAYVPATGFNDINFDTPFNWNGTDNILVDICFKDAPYLGFSSTAHGQCWTYTGVTNSYRSIQADGSDQCGVTTSTATQTAKPRVRFYMQQGPACTGTPVAGTISPASKYACTGDLPGAITATGIAPAVPGIVYQWEESTNNGTTWANAVGGSGQTTTTYTPPALVGTGIQYRLKTTCTNSSAFATSSVVSIGPSAPTTQATALLQGNTGFTSTALSWTIGNGSRRAVYISTAPITNPVSGTAIPAYTAATAYTGSGQQLIYDGTGTSVTVTGLTCGTTYYVKVFDYNRCGSGPYDVYFSTTTGTNGLTITTPVVGSIPATNSFTGFTGANMATASVGWFEAAITTAAGATPTTANPAGLTSSWTNSTAFTATTARINLTSNSKNEWIISPKLAIAAASRVKFKAAITNNAAATANATGMQGTDDKVTVQISTDCGATWTALYTFSAANTTTLTNALTDFVVNIPASYIGQTVQIGFQGTEGPIDDTPNYDFHIGSVVVEAVPACDKPILTATTNITKNGATINWNVPAAGIPTGYQYVVSTTNTTPTGAGTATTATTVNVGSLTSSTTYYVFVRTACGADFSDWTVAGTFKTLCNYDDITGSTPGSHCGSGTVALSVASTGTVKWYDVATGGTSLATGLTYSPNVIATKTFYAGTELLGTATAGGARVSTTATSNTTASEYGLVFDVTSSFVLNSVDVYLADSAAGNLVIALKDNAGVQLQTITVPVPAGNSTTPVQHTVNLGWTIPVGTGYRLLAMSSTAMVRESSLGGFPYAIGSVGSVTNGYITGTSTTYYFFYNWNFTSVCSSPRVPVVATINTPPAFTLSGNPAAVCTGLTTAAVTITAGAADYNTYTWSPSAGVSGSAAAGWTFNPAVSTVYTLQASSATCNAVPVTVNVTINPYPNALVIPAAIGVCEGQSQALTVTGGIITKTGTIGTGTTAPGTTSYPNPLSAYYGGTKTQILFTETELLAMGMANGNTISSISFDMFASVANALTDMQIRLGATTNTNLTAGIVPSTGLTTVYNGTYTPTAGATGFVALNLTTPYTYTGGNLVIEVVHNAGNGGNGSGTRTNTTTTTFDSVYTQAKDNVAGGVPGFDAEATYSISATSTSRPNIRFDYNVINPVVWSPVTGLYTDAAATVAYTGQNLKTVYAKPTAATTYTITATSAGGCATTATTNVTITVTAAPTVPAATQEFCNAGTVANLVATGTGIKWYAAATGGTALAPTTALVNNTQYFASQTVGGCESVARTGRTAVINVVAAPTIANTTQTFCNVGTVAELLPNDASIKWYAASTGGTALLSTEALVDGTQYYASQTVNGCEGLVRTAVTVSLNVVAAPAISNDQQVFCNNATVADLLPNDANIKWYSSATGGTALLSTDALVSGTTYYASQTVNGCEGLLRGAVTATVLVTPAPSINDMTPVFCNSATVADLIPNDASIKWYAAATGGIVLASTEALVDGTSYFASQTVDGCEGIIRTEVIATINVTAAPTGDDEQEFCGSAVVGDLSAEGDTITWFDAETAGNALTADVALVDGTVYYASQSIDGCEGLTRFAVTAVIHNVVADAPADVNVCTEYVLPALTSGAYFTEAGGQGTELAAGSAVTETTTVYVYAQEGTDVVCSDENSFVVTVANIPAPTGDASQTIEANPITDAFVSDLQADAQGTITWYATLADAQAGTNPLAADTPLVQGATYYATQTVDTCTSVEALAVTVDIVLDREGFDIKAFSFYPNPVKDILNLSYSSEITSVTVFNLLGQKVIAQHTNATDVRVDMSSLADGAYIVNVASGNTVKTIKVIKKQ
ncbi:MAG: hypothetical protein DI539_12050 [Flavobacterium psychrophilum]|nr:MAG: hypothetical protein DI539_12050 [Flavobacterium psychrophilum]